MNTLVELLNYGQSYWLDNLTRKKISSGELKKRVSQQGLRGITSNPSIFNKAITESDSYDAQIIKLVKQGNSAQQTYDILTVKDLQDACDILKPVYNSSKGADGFVSLEVSPYLAHDTQGTIEEVKRLFREVNRLNCFIKIPGTKEGLPAIEEMLYEGIPINITLLFSVERYVEVAQAYIRALERRAAERKQINNIISVASFFLSRIDVLTDQLLGHHIIPAKDITEVPSNLLGKAGIASARIAYQRFKELFSSPSWKKLESKGAHVQRLLWASTSNKDPLYDDLRYVEPLIGPDTVNTLPDETIEALADHGQLRKNSIEENLDQANQLFGQLKEFDIDIEFVTQQLENDGIEKFIDAYNKLLGNLSKKRTDILGKQVSTEQISFDSSKNELKAVYASLDEKQAGRRLFAKDPHLWENDPEQVKVIDNRLGWLTFPKTFGEKAEEIIAFSKKIKQEGYKYAVLLGMGGSSLCSEVARETFAVSKGYLKLFVLDNTDPAATHDLEKQIDIEKTLFIAASKSGTTKETLCFFKYFYDQIEKKGKGKTGNNFISITDEGTPLVKISEEYKFRKAFINPTDVGGRYSVLSYFGLLPMALMGIDIKGLLLNAKQMENSCDPFIPASVNQGVNIGALLGMAQSRTGGRRDKITFVLSSSISSFGYWAEQLIAESTGKEGKGLIPVSGEQLGSPDVYGNDRIFVHIYLASDDNTLNNKKLLALEKAGHPIVRIGIPDKLSLGGEYYRLEVATAIAGMVMGINPFDEPNVAESKKNTDRILDEWQQKKTFSSIVPAIEKGYIAVYAGGKAEKLTGKKYLSIGAFVKAFVAMAQPGEYIALLPYFLKTDKRSKVLQSWRQEMRDHLKVATTLLHGPRYLHSTGQLHKGGPDTGLYIILTGAENEELPIPGEKFGFETLHHAQALGDFKSLSDKGRRVIRINLGTDVDRGLEELWQSVKTGKGKRVK
jgi:transaldolase/glucose-6-phosphate isomerase